MPVYINNNIGANEKTLQETNTLLGNMITLLGTGGSGGGGSNTITITNQTAGAIAFCSSTTNTLDYSSNFTYDTTTNTI